MWIRRFLASSGFWIVSVYVLFYLITVLGFLWLLFGILGSEIENSLKSDIEREQSQIISSLARGDITDITRHIEQLIKSTDPDSSIYILLDGNGNTLTSNYPRKIDTLSEWIHLPKVENTHTTGNDRLTGDLTLHTSSSHDQGYIGRAAPGDNYTLFTGKSLKRIDETKRVVVRLALIVLPLSLFLATLAGIVFSRITTRRIEVINQQCRTIRQRGDISLRIPNEKPDDEYGLLIANINAMLETIDRSIKNVQAVSDDVAHDLRTPLTRIKYSLETGLGKSAATVSELREILESASRETDKVLQTFSAILRISQLNTGLRKARFQVFDVTALMQTICEAYEPTAEEMGHKLVFDHSGGLCFARGDKDMLTQLISNLVENCFEHAGLNLNIHLGVTCRPDEIEITVQDNGHGIPGDEHGKIFGKFYRVDKSRSASGSGLGLAIVNAITDLHGGNIQVESAAPGTKFLVTLPRGDTSGR